MDREKYRVCLALRILAGISGSRVTGRVYCSPRVIRCVCVCVCASMCACVCLYNTCIPSVLFPTPTSECFADNEPIILYYIIAGARNTVVVLRFLLLLLLLLYKQIYHTIPLCILPYFPLQRLHTHII